MCDSLAARSFLRRSFEKGVFNVARIGRRLAQARGYLDEIEFGQIEPFVRAITALFLLFAVFRLSELTNFTFNIDDEFAPFRNPADISVWLWEGRGTAYFFEQTIARSPEISPVASSV